VRTLQEYAWLSGTAERKGEDHGRYDSLHL
jgi:hypothetical protein